MKHIKTAGNNTYAFIIHDRLLHGQYFSHNAIDSGPGDSRIA
jgi:hypothetical protein